MEKGPISEELLINSFKLLSKFAHLYYEPIHEWKEYPTSQDIDDDSKLAVYIKKAIIAINIVLNRTDPDKEKHIARVLRFTQSLLNVPTLKSDVSKLSLLSSNGIILLKLISAKTDKEKNEIMIQYLTTIIKSFHCAYKDTFASLYEIISNNLALFNNAPAFFDYEAFFFNEDEYLQSVIVPRIYTEINKLNESFGEDIVALFALDSIDCSNELDLLYIMNVLFELKDFTKYKATYTPEEYIAYKQRTKEKLIAERLEKAKANVQEQSLNSNKANSIQE